MNESISVWDCKGCDGTGAIAGCVLPENCPECDGTGKRHRVVWTTENGLTCEMSGNGPMPDPNTKAAAEMVWRAAAAEVHRVER